MHVRFRVYIVRTSAIQTVSTQACATDILTCNTGCAFVDLVSMKGRSVVLEAHFATAPLASFKECTFINPAISGGEAPTIVVKDGGSLRLEECTLEATPTGTPVIVTDATSTVYSDDATLTISPLTAAAARCLQIQLQTVQPLEGVPATVTFLSGDDDLIADAREVRHSSYYSHSCITGPCAARVW